MAKLTEKKINIMLHKVWNGGFKLPKKYIIPRDRLKEHLIKMDSYKYKKSKIKYQRAVFGIADGDVMTLKSIIYLIDRVDSIKKGD